MPGTTRATRHDDRVATLSPLLRRADGAQRAAFLALLVDSYGLRAVVEAVDRDDADPNSVPPPHIPDHLTAPLAFHDMYGNEYENWYDCIQAATNGEFGRISGIGPGPWDAD